MLNATGIACKRVNMSHDATTETSYSEFGKGHFEDAASRLYRVVARQRTSDEPHWADLIDGDRLVVDVRIPKASNLKRAEHIRAGAVGQARVTFPRVGDTVRVVAVPFLRTDRKDLEFYVTFGAQSRVRSSVARLVVRVLSA